jgi:hypothetical protein
VRLFRECETGILNTRSDLHVIPTTVGRNALSVLSS